MEALFVNGLLNDTPTIIEAGMYERVKVFAALGVRAKVVTLAFSPAWGSAVEAAGLQRDQVISGFDWLQQVPPLPLAPLTAAVFPGPAGTTREWHEDRYRYYRDGHLVAALKPTAAGAVSGVQYYEDGHLIKRERYDERGFLSQVQHFGGGKLTGTDYLTPTGKVALRQKNRSDLTTEVIGTGAQYATRAAFEAGLLKALIPAGALVISERREYDQAIAALPAPVKRGYRLYNSALTITPDPAALVLARRYLPALPAVTVFDEYAPEAQLQRGWQRLLGAMAGLN